MPREKERTTRLLDNQLIDTFTAAYDNYRLFSDISLIPYDIIRRVLSQEECTPEEKGRVILALDKYLPHIIEARITQGDVPKDVQDIIGRLLFAIRKKDHYGRVTPY